MTSVDLIRPMPPLLDPGTPCRTSRRLLEPMPRCTTHSSRLWPPPLARAVRALALQTWALSRCHRLLSSTAMSNSLFTIITLPRPSPLSTRILGAAHDHLGHLPRLLLATLLAFDLAPLRLEPRPSVMVADLSTAIAAMPALLAQPGQPGAIQ